MKKSLTDSFSEAFLFCNDGNMGVFPQGMDLRQKNGKELRLSIQNLHAKDGLIQRYSLDIAGLMKTKIPGLV